MELQAFKTYRIIAYRTCYSLVNLLKPFFGSQVESMRPVMRRSRLRVTSEEYFSTMLFTVLLIFPFSFFLFQLVFSSLYGLTAMAAVLLALIFSAVTAGIIYTLFMVYPQYRIDGIKRDIELNIPYATTHMATIAGTGVPIYAVFRLVSEFTEYGEIAQEYKKIARNIEVFGTDTLTAISESAAESPSPHLKELLWSIVSVIRSGGDLRRLLIDKADNFMDYQRRLEEQYLDSLSLMAEMYTTIFVAGPILFVVMVTIMGSMGNLPLPTDLLLSLAIYILLPVLSVGFMVLVEGSKPIGTA